MIRHFAPKFILDNILYISYYFYHLLAQILICLRKYWLQNISKMTLLTFQTQILLKGQMISCFDNITFVECTCIMYVKFFPPCYNVVTTCTRLEKNTFFTSYDDIGSVHPKSASIRHYGDIISILQSKHTYVMWSCKRARVTYRKLHRSRRTVFMKCT